MVDERGCAITPTGHVFALHAAHRGGISMRVDNLSPRLSDGGDDRGFCRQQYLDHDFAGLPAISGSASCRDGRLTVTAVNADPGRSRELCVRAPAALGDAEVLMLAPTDLRACNRPGEPAQVAPQLARRLAASDGCWRIALPPGAVVRLRG